MAISADDVAAGRVLPRSLAGATVLQITPSLGDDTLARTTVDVARALVRVGARAIVASDPGPLVADLRGFGGEWMPFSGTTFSPRKLRTNAETLSEFVQTERVDIVHAKNAGSAWSAKVATDRHGARLVTELPDLPPARMRVAAYYLGALTRGDRVITRSLFNARPMADRYRIPPERMSVIPRGLDMAAFDPTQVAPGRVAALRHSWGIPSGVRILLVPSTLTPTRGQITLIPTARMLAEGGLRGFTFVLAGDDRRNRRYARAIHKRAQREGVEALFRLVGHCADMPAAYAAADFVVVPSLTPPLRGRVVAEAQTMARPVIASAVGLLPEYLAAPPRIPPELRTGWVVRPGDSIDQARALADALELKAPEYRALAARARQFAELMFAPSRVAQATLEVYSSLLHAES